MRKLVHYLVNVVVLAHTDRGRKNNSNNPKYDIITFVPSSLLGRNRVGGRNSVSQSVSQSGQVSK